MSGWILAPRRREWPKKKTTFIFIFLTGPDGVVRRLTVPWVAVKKEKQTTREKNTKRRQTQKQNGGEPLKKPRKGEEALAVSQRRCQRGDLEFDAHLSWHFTETAIFRLVL